MDWSNKEIIRFIKLYQAHPCIWDPQDASFKNRPSLKKAWIDIKDQMGERYTIKELKRKKESLMAAYRSYRYKILRSELNRDDGSDAAIYQPSWFAYETIDSFLGSIYKCNPRTAAQNQQDLEDEDTDYADQVYKEEIYVEAETSDLEQELSTSSLNEDPVPLQTAGPVKKRKYSEPRRTKTPENESVNKRKTMYLKQDDDSEDECYHFAKIVEKKLRKLPEDRRERVMMKMNQLLYEEYQNCDRLS